jgi:hypothetical protein
MPITLCRYGAVNDPNSHRLTFDGRIRKKRRLSTVSGRWVTGIAQWALTLLAVSLAVITLALVVYMLYPGDATSLPHGVTARALFFPLHLLVVTVVALGLGLAAWWLRARVAASIFGLAVTLSWFLALWPTVAIWRLARRENVPVARHIPGLRDPS